jgi:endonuclease YncB( thermonuclease family)
MNKKKDNENYMKLLTEISSIYENTRTAFVRMYWTIGKYIVEVEQKNREKGEYGDYLTTRLAEDLTEKYGKGFSKTNLSNMRLFYRTYSIDQISDRLDWSSYVTLISVKDDSERKLLEERAVNEKLKYHELKKIASTFRKEKQHRSSGKNLPVPVRGLLNRYSLPGPAGVSLPENTILVDCGFNILKEVPVKKPGNFAGTKFISRGEKGGTPVIESADDVTPSLLYTYRAVVEKVIDGDTIRVVVDCGFGTHTRQKLRLKSIDCPELDTPGGKKAKRYVEQALKGLPFVIVKTYKSDKYDRYLTDLFYLPGVHGPEEVAAGGRFLNSELVERGLAVVY